MALNSMTGFARTDGSSAGQRWTWELRSVNGKGLDVRLRLPPGLERLEIPTRERAGRRLVRGNCSFTLTVLREHAATQLRINEAALAAVVEAMRLIAERIETAPPSLDGILAVKGVVETADAEDDEAARAAFDAAVLDGLDRALDALVEARAREGAAVAAVLAGHLDTVEALAKAAEANPARSVEAIRERLAEQVRALLDAVPALDPQRLHQEAVLIATRADIREELDRLFAHVAQGRALIRDGGAVGRRLDFLAQEFNRESNTLCSKSNDRALTAIGLDLKTVVDQFREQIQNVE
ncbi:YicC/YloC family endoribonuclease [Prosthecodimorpha staleyi]|uniref:YicC family protein n=1 Tax=Prosthecodimorpha staleyi TaxID=2840188 RepID=A0A947GBC0_9HYPH|nr:YicC/YloC family endoribonuclease [Prosthecodimorpha staleyi]MBT9290103.1 YicC family protein [Prosthecodimorpha staleyi]